MNSLTEQFGNMDIYLIDQLMKGRFDNCEKILDIGCGSGRNMFYFLQNDFDVYAIDQDPRAIQAIQNLATSINADYPQENFQQSQADQLPFPDESFDWVIANAVFHFSDNTAHFEAMLYSAFSVLNKGGYLLVRTASNIGLETQIQKDDCQVLLPDGSHRFIISHDDFMRYTDDLKARFFEPLKTTNVNNLRCMTTWCIQKPN